MSLFDCDIKHMSGRLYIYDQTNFYLSKILKYFIHKKNIRYEYVGFLTSGLYQNQNCCHKFLTTPNILKASKNLRHICATTFLWKGKASLLAKCYLLVRCSINKYSRKHQRFFFFFFLNSFSLGNTEGGDHPFFGFAFL